MKPVIVGCRTESFTPEQLAAFREHVPFGMIVFAEPCRRGPEAVREVIRQFRSACPRSKIFIDAEGGRVNRLKPEFWHGWRDIPDARSFAAQAETDLPAAMEQIFQNARSIGTDLKDLGIDVNCAPVADLVHAEAIANQDADGKPHATSASLFRRSFGHDPAIVTECVRAFLAGLESAGVCGVVKHVPGYGRVSADPHYAQSGIAAALAELERTDFLPFRNLSEVPAMMTGHVLYPQIDAQYSSTLSPKIIDIIRNQIGFKGVLIADSIEMNSVWPAGFSTTARDQFGMGLPLAGTLAFVTRAALEAGCDLVMHSDCSREFAHTLEILEAAPTLTEQRAEWLVGKLSVPERARRTED
jgi:beta-N-acetylhexosaminidase